MVNRMRREEARVNYCTCQSLKYITLSFCYFVRSMGLWFGGWREIVSSRRREEAEVNYCTCQSVKYITLPFVPTNHVTIY